MDDYRDKLAARKLLVAVLNADIAKLPPEVARARRELERVVVKMEAAGKGVQK